MLICRKLEIYRERETVNWLETREEGPNKYVTEESTIFTLIVRQINSIPYLS